MTVHINYRVEYTSHLGSACVLSHSAPLGTPFSQVLADNASEGWSGTYLGMSFEHYAWPGGYDIEYVTKGGDALCASCLNSNLDQALDPDNAEWHPAVMQATEEGSWQCDHCSGLFGNLEDDEDD